MAVHVEGLALVLAPPGVDGRLQFIALVEQGAVARREFGRDGFEAGPEPRSIEAGARQRLAVDECLQSGIDGQAAEIDGIAHCALTPKVIDCTF
jgi:hypothetical protein